MLFLIVSLLVISGTILFFLGVNTLQRRDTPAIMPFIAILFSASLWSFGFAVEVISTSLENKIFWANIQFIGINILSFSWFLMALYYTGQPRQTIRNLYTLAIMPLLTILVIWTNPYDLFRGTPSLEVITQTFSVLNSEYGIYFYAIYVPFNWLLNVGSLFLLFRFWIKSPAVYRRQRMILALSFLLPFSVDILYIAGISPIPNFNFTLVSPK